MRNKFIVNSCFYLVYYDRDHVIQLLYTYILQFVQFYLIQDVNFVFFGGHRCFEIILRLPSGRVHSLLCITIEKISRNMHYKLPQNSLISF